MLHRFFLTAALAAMIGFGATAQAPLHKTSGLKTPAATAPDSLAAKPAAGCCAAFTDTIAYSVNYHWGFINKQAGSGTVELAVTPDKVAGTDTLQASLTGASVPWFGRVYQVKDTLKAVMTRLNDVNPNVIHELVLHQNGLYSKPAVVGTDGSKAILAPVKATRNIYGQGTLNADASTMEAVRITSDMLGAFYYARVIDWDALNPGDTMVMPIEWDAAPEGCSATVTYKGKSQCTINGKVYPTWQIGLDYTFEGKPSGYVINVQIGQAMRLPLLMSADIAIGHVEMVYNPAAH